MDAQWQIAHTEQNISRASSLVIDGKFISIYCLFESISTQAERVLVTVSRHSKAAASGQPGVGVRVGDEFGSEVR